MENVKNTYTAFHQSKLPNHTYPTEWVIRTFLGKYPLLNLDKNWFPSSKILDLGFGDCRNMPLLKNCGFEIHGVEISKPIIELANAKLAHLGITAKLSVGSNVNIPYPKNEFDYLLACHSCYYIDAGSTFSDNLLEMARVIKPGGVILASLPAPDNFILKDSEPLTDGHVIIKNDIYGLRNGYIFRTFESKAEVEKTFSPYFDNIKVCHCMENFWGVQINYFLIAGNKK